MDLQDLGAIGLRIETKGEDLAKMSLIEYVRTVDSSVGKLQSYISRLNALSNQREKALAKEIQDNIKLGNSAQALAAQREKALAEETKAAQRAADARIAASRKALTEALAVSRSYQSISRQRQRELEAEEKSSKQLLSANMADTRAMISLGRQREDAIQEEAASRDRLLNAYNRLNASVSSAAQAQMMLDRAQETLNASLREGVINATQYATTMQHVRDRVAMMGHGVNQFGEVLEGNERMAARWARGGIQQAGYQVNDFFIQIQSGTPFVIAFSQQFSQLVGEFGKWGAVAGAGVAIIGVLVSLYQSWSNETKSLKDMNDALFKSVDKVIESMQRLNDENLNETFGSATEAVRELTETMLELEKVAVMKELRSTLEQMRSEIETGFSDQILGALAVAANSQNVLSPGFDGAPVTMESVLQDAKKNNFEDLGFQESFSLQVFEGITAGIDEAAKKGDYETIAVKVREMMQLAFGDIEGYNKAIDGGGAELLSTYAELAIKTAEMAAQLDASAQSAAEENERRKEYLELLVQTQETMGEFVRERAAQDRQNQEDSDRFFKNRIEAVAGAALEEVAAAEKIAAANKTIYDVLEDITGLDITGVFKDGSAAADRLLAKVNGLLPGFARLGALATAYGQHGMGNVLGLNKDGTPILRGIYQEGTLDNVVRGQMAQRGNPFGSLASGAAGAFVAEGGGGGGGGGAKQDAMQKLMEQIALEKELLGLTEAQQRVRRALGEDRAKYSEAEINAVIQEIEAMEAKKRSMEQMEDIARTIEQAMGDAFTSMVDGTKSVGDAFKDMARAIVSELFQVLVVQQLVGSWNSSTGSGTGIVGAIMGAFQADGGAWQGGNQVQAFANGGVVNGPTFFGMSGGRTGLMGEAGPEAIMPLKRGADGKLGVSMNGGGGGDNINVTNNISLPGNQDPAAVRNEIAKALPQIVEATKSAVIQARQRGGEMRRTFGGK